MLFVVDKNLHRFNEQDDIVARFRSQQEDLPSRIWIVLYFITYNGNLVPNNNYYRYFMLSTSLGHAKIYEKNTVNEISNLQKKKILVEMWKVPF